MRIYTNLIEAKSEIARDLKELGVKVDTKTYQNLNTDDNPDLSTYELTNYHYQILNVESIEPKHRYWADEEWMERIAWGKINPGSAWKLREDYWSTFLMTDGCFDYTYNERFNLNSKINEVYQTLLKDPNSRRAILNIWEGFDVPRANKNIRVPCSLYYQFRVKHDRLNICYVMRSCDFVEHWQNDIYLACRMQSYIADLLDRKSGTLDHFIHSFHVYQKDVAGVF